MNRILEMEAYRSLEMEANINAERVRRMEADVNEMVASCNTELEEAMPALEQAKCALCSLTKGDINEIRRMKQPTAPVLRVMEAICIMLGVKPDKIKDPGGGTGKIDDYWGPAQKVVLADASLLQNLESYDKDNMPPEMIAKIATAYAADPEFYPEVVKKDSVAAAGLCTWVRAMIVYDKVVKNIGPKMAAVSEAQETLAAAKAELAEQMNFLVAALNDPKAIAQRLEDNDTSRKQRMRK